MTTDLDPDSSATDGPVVTVSALDHIVLACADVEATMAWYVEVLGLVPLRVAEWRAGAVPFPSVRIDEGTIIDLIEGEHESGRLDHVCLVVEPTDLAALAGSGTLDVVSGPVTRQSLRPPGQRILPPFKPSGVHPFYVVFQNILQGTIKAWRKAGTGKIDFVHSMSI